MQESQEKTTLINEISKLPIIDCKEILELLTGINLKESFKEVNDLYKFMNKNDISTAKAIQV